MAPDAANSTSSKGLVSASTAYKIAAANLIAGISGTAIAALIKNTLASGFAAGYILGVINIFWLMRIVRKGINLEAEKAGRLVARSYYVRFAATALIFAYIISKGWLSPLPLLIGLTGSIFTTVVVMIFVAVEEAS